MHRNEVINKLNRYLLNYKIERDTVHKIIHFVQNNPSCFDRSLKTGHITGSAWLLNASFNQVLLTHHKKLNKWLQLGGHADGNSNILSVSIKEAEEESGIRTITAVSEDIFDIDVHMIPAFKNENKHFHFDIRFLLYASSGLDFILSNESHELRWFTLEDLEKTNPETSIARMVSKWRSWLTCRS